MSNEELAKYLKQLAMAIPKGAPKDLDALAFAWGERFRDVTPEMMTILINQSMDKFEHFPSLKELKDMLVGSVEDNAKEVGQLIWAAIGKYGSQLGRWPEIAQMITPLGEHIVTAMGGWHYLCDTLTNDDRMSFIAQTRDLAISLQRKPIMKRQDAQLEGTKSDFIKKQIEEAGKRMLSLN